MKNNFRFFLLSLLAILATSQNCQGMYYVKKTYQQLGLYPQQEQVYATNQPSDLTEIITEIPTTPAEKISKLIEQYPDQIELTRSTYNKIKRIDLRVGKAHFHASSNTDKITFEDFILESILNNIDLLEKNKKKSE